MGVAGAEVLAAGLCRNLGDRFDFVFLCLDDVGTLGEQLADEGFSVECLHRRPGVDFALGRRLRAAVNRHRVNLIHAHQYTPFFYAGLSRGLGGRPPVLFTEHGRHYPDMRKRRRVVANRLLLRRGDAITAVGHFVADALVKNEGLSPRRIQTIHNGIDPAGFDPPDTPAYLDSRRRTRAELRLSDDQPTLLQVARFHPVKDHATSLRAFAHVHAAVPRAVLLLAGDGPQRENMQALAGQLGIAPAVRFLGLRRDIRDLMAAADAFVLSSLSEGLSVTLLEAMAAGLPIAATRVGGNAEVVEHGITGLLSPRGDAEPLARHLMHLLRDPVLRRKMGNAGRQRLHSQFTEHQMHAAYARLYTDMAC